jgi:hypothetical protein
MKYRIKEASAAGNEPSRYLTKPITVTKQSPEPSIHNIPKDVCLVKFSTINYC